MAKRDNHLAARALTDWARHRFASSQAAEIAATYGVGTRTVWNWKNALDDDQELAALYRQAIQAHVTSDWADQLDAALQAAITRLLELIAIERDLAKVTEAFAKLSEVAIAKEMLRGALTGEPAPGATTSDGSHHRHPAPIGPN
jgi:hypothetical protein